MTFDQDPGEQARISASDFAQMCDEMKAICGINDELLATVRRCEMWFSVSDQGERMQQVCKDAIIKATGKEGA